MRSCPRLVKHLRTPKVLWHQTDVSIVLRIMLVDVKDYFLLVDLDHVRFRYVYSMINNMILILLARFHCDFLIICNLSFSIILSQYSRLFVIFLSARQSTIESTISASISLALSYPRSVCTRTSVERSE